MKKFTVVNIISEPFEPEILSGFLWETEPSGIEELSNSLNLFFESEDENIKSKLVEILDELKSDGMLDTYEINYSVFEDQNWNEEWEKGIKVINVTDKIVIKPTFRDYNPKPDEIVITIDPKMSFGTGEHQTTKLILSLLEKFVSSNQRILDVGSGTAVLAIAALKLGATSAVAVDNDEWCLDNGIENARLNDVENLLQVKLGEIKDIEDSGFDLILANIQRNVLLPIAPQICERVKNDGLIILSGLLIDDEKVIVEKYSTFGFKLLEKSRMDEWIALVFQKTL
ncbi:MAG TPA: 50S ribosomal protein L11 methyltransferase [Ignavibacteriaceae bacterium]|nr:50S ribosomal protein L11 methyltransferase [Ignavibacteriaceae bacterium]